MAAPETAAASACCCWAPIDGGSGASARKTLVAPLLLPEARRGRGGIGPLSPSSPPPSVVIVAIEVDAVVVLPAAAAAAAAAAAFPAWVLSDEEELMASIDVNSEEVRAPCIVLCEKCFVLRGKALWWAEQALG